MISFSFYHLEFATISETVSLVLMILPRNFYHTLNLYTRFHSLIIHYTLAHPLIKMKVYLILLRIPFNFKYVKKFSIKCALTFSWNVVATECHSFLDHWYNEVEKSSEQWVSRYSTTIPSQQEFARYSRYERQHATGQIIPLSLARHPRYYVDGSAAMWRVGPLL